MTVSYYKTERHNRFGVKKLWKLKYRALNTLLVSFIGNTRVFSSTKWKASFVMTRK